MPRKQIPNWTPFARAHLSAATRAKMPDAKEQEVWRNSRYQVHVSRNVPNGFGAGVIWLSIKNVHSPRSRHDWRDLQRIKNELVGPECDAIEIYPAESRLHDGADQWHLWVFPEDADLPIGFLGRFVSEGHPGGTGSQRQFDRDARPGDLQTADEMNARDPYVQFAGQALPVNPADPESTQSREEIALRALDAVEFSNVAQMVDRLKIERAILTEGD